MAEMGQKTGTVHKFTYHARGSPGLRDFPPNALPKQLKRLGSAPSGGPTPVVEEAAPKCLREVKQGPPPLEASYIGKMHLRDVIAPPGMVGSIVGVYNLKTFNQGESQA